MHESPCIHQTFPLYVPLCSCYNISSEPIIIKHLPILLSIIPTSFVFPIIFIVSVTRMYVHNAHSDYCTEKVFSSRGCLYS